MRQVPSGPHSLGLCSVGYDQRLSVWRLALPSGHRTAEEEPATLRSSAGEESCPLEWIAGDMVNVGDVNAMALVSEEGSSSGGVLVVGEGFQLFDLKEY
jgi:hypothetical protein